MAQRISGSGPIDEDEEEIFQEEIRSMASEGERGGWLEARVRDMLEGVLDLDNTAVAKVMTPRSRVDSLEVGTDWEVMLTFVVETERTRLPAYRQQIDNVVGILYTKDLLTELLKPAENVDRYSDCCGSRSTYPSRLDSMSCCGSSSSGACTWQSSTTSTRPFRES